MSRTCETCHRHSNGECHLIRFYALDTNVFEVEQPYLDGSGRLPKRYHMTATDILGRSWLPHTGRTDDERRERFKLAQEANRHRAGEGPPDCPAYVLHRTGGDPVLPEPDISTLVENAWRWGGAP